jgi:hypothetical protein
MKATQSQMFEAHRWDDCRRDDADEPLARDQMASETYRVASKRPSKPARTRTFTEQLSIVTKCPPIAKAKQAADFSARLTSATNRSQFSQQDAF